MLRFRRLGPTARLDACRARIVFEDGDAPDMAERHDQWLKI